jgi:AbrB family looped-hinge helix DNA binding protein
MKTEGVVSSKGQLVIPAELRKLLRIGRGTRVRFERIPGEIGVYPKHQDDIDRLCGCLAGLGLPPDIDREPDRGLE